MFVGWNEFQIVGCCYFNKCGDVVVGYVLVGFYFFIQWICYLCEMFFFLCGGNYGFYCFFVVVGDGQGNILCIRENFLKFFFYCLSYFVGRKVFFVRVWGNDDFYNFVV